MNSRKWSLPLKELVKVLEPKEIVPLPLAPKTVIGVLYEGGEVIPVIDDPGEGRMDEQYEAKNNPDMVLVTKTSEGNIGIKIDAIEKVTGDSDAEFTEEDNINMMNLTEFLEKTLGE